VTGRNLSRRSAAIALGVALLMGAPVARADVQAEATALSLFEQGRTLRKQGDCAGALPLFRKAYDIYPGGLGSLRNIAECEEALSNPASAYDTWAALRRALATHTEPKYAGWNQDAQDAEARLGAQLARLRFGATLAAVRPPAPALPSSPRLSAPSAPLPSSPSAATRSDSGSRSHDDSPAHTAGWVAIGIGGAAAVALAVSFAVRQSALSEIDSQCPNHAKCDLSLEATADRGRTASVLVDVFAGIAAAGVATGVVLLTVVGPHASAALGVLPRGGFATLTF
jgi:hypothetical protein